MKIVINKCFGGFGLSDVAMRRYAELKGLTLYPEVDQKFKLTTWWTIPPKKRPKPLKEPWHKNSLKARQKYNEAYNKATLYDNDIERDDSALVQTVKELGNKANGHHAKLKIVEVPDDVDWEITEYDGNESIAEKHQTWG